MNLLTWRKRPWAWVRKMPQQYRKYSPPPGAFGMTENNELCLLETYAREAFTGRGRIVDLGCWFGATTMSLARGLAANGLVQGKSPIQAFDLFEWQDWMDRLAKQVPLPREYAAGQSFFSEVEQLLAPYRELVNLRQQDLLDYTPDPEPIEFLFIDAMKSWELAQKIVFSFFPLLLEQGSYVVHQDFAFYHALVATNHLLMWHLRDHFRCVHHVPGACSVVFFCTKQCDPQHLSCFRANLFSPDLVGEAYAYCRSCVSRDMRPRLEIAHLSHLIEQGFAEPALRQMDRVSSLPSSHVSQAMLAEVRRAVKARSVAISGADPPVLITWLAQIDAWTTEAMNRRR